MYELCPQAARYGSISCTTERWRSQFPVLYAFKNRLSISTIDMYCSQSSHVRPLLINDSFFSFICLLILMAFILSFINSGVKSPFSSWSYKEETIFRSLKSPVASECYFFLDHWYPLCGIWHQSLFSPWSLVVWYLFCFPRKVYWV